MKKIIQYIDTLMDPFPYNPQSENIRIALQKKAMRTYKHNLEMSMDKEKAFDDVISKLPSPQKIALYIPNKHQPIYYITIAILLLIGIGITIMVTNPYFLQIFYPLELVFPHIIRNYIYHLMVVGFTYIILDYLLPMVPNEKLNLKPKAKIIILYTATVLMALYFSIAIAFCWFTFNGFVVSDFSSSPAPFFLYHFYRWIIRPTITTIFYSILCGILISLGKKHYHLEKEALPLDLDELLKAFNSKKEAVKEEKTTLNIEINLNHLWYDYCRIHYFKSNNLEKKEFITFKNKTTTLS